MPVGRGLENERQRRRMGLIRRSAPASVRSSPERGGEGDEDSVE